MNQKSQSSSSPSSQPPKPQSGPSSSKQASGTPHRDDASRGEQSGSPGIASDVASQMAQSAERQFAGGKERAAKAITQIAGALRQTGDELLEKEMPVAHDYLGRVATQVEGVSTYLQKKELGDVVGDLESFARREPILFVGSAFVVGLIGGRFLKSSRPPTNGPTTEGRGSAR